ncbi:MAG TPA: hypothetical protein DG761_05435 [Gammaproteobacteria bacterium]|jgi:hypothetical protein|nr:hypothetical protein [Acidiferrobacteraceae bacterium]MDP6398850.1 hypothetical protein [Arenicellales bacterium]HCX87446.1 hypothetical protein [Gammaproteobacteria bacterium]MDP6550624.1 hypothetical protein [Arenicellales bacterium]MDP6791539.1 hypothetical protein [Arenicellales bacterium]|tara:strand:- start:166 stop:363 length:198 start_codon:yes stop_codon:yes gene_type:complete
MSSVPSAHTASAFAATPLKAQAVLDNKSGRQRIGLIALASDYVMECGIMNMRPGDFLAAIAATVD